MMSHGSSRPWMTALCTTTWVVTGTPKETELRRGKYRYEIDMAKVHQRAANLRTIAHCAMASAASSISTTVVKSIQSNRPECGSVMNCGETLARTLINNSEHFTDGLARGDARKPKKSGAWEGPRLFKYLFIQLGRTTKYNHLHSISRSLCQLHAWVQICLLVYCLLPDSSSRSGIPLKA